MTQRLLRAASRALLLLVGSAALATAQTPGLIYQPATTTLGRTVFDPNGDGYVSATRSGFLSSNDGAAAMELAMLRTPSLVSDPINDLATSSGGGQLDFIGNTSGDGGVVYVMRRTVDGVNYFVIRLRVGANATSGKAWALLIDTDGSIAAAGRNPGYEREVLLISGSGGAVEVHDLVPGTTTVTTRGTPYDLGEHHQRALAAGGNVFYDYFVPESGLGISASASLRFAAVTVTNGTSAITGTVADVGGIRDTDYGNNTTTLLKLAGQSFPTGATLNTIGAGTSFGGIVTATPTITSTITTASTAISGVSTEADGTAIRVYKNGATLIGSTTVSGGSWSVSGISGLVAGDLITAEAEASGKSVSARSASVTVTGVASCYVTAPVITSVDNGAKTLTGTWTAEAGTPTGPATITVFYQTTLNAFGFTQQTESGGPTTVSSGGTWTFATGLNQNVFSGRAYFAVATVGSCASPFSNISVGGTAGGTATTAPTITTTTILASVGSTNVVVRNNHASSAILYLYVNGVLQGTSTSVASGATYTFSYAGFVEGERVTSRALGSVSNYLSSASTAVIVSAASATPTTAPTITGSYTSGSNKTVSGTSDELAGTVITLFKTVSAVTTQIGTATVNSSGNWSVTGLTLATGDVLSATAKASGKPVSSSSNTVTVAAGIPTAPVITSTTLTAGASTSISGTGGLGTITVYVDGSPLGTTTGASWTLSGFAASELYRGAVITATNTVSGIESPASNSVTVVGVRSFTITQLDGSPIADQIAGVEFPFKVTAYDGLNGTGAVVTGFTGTVVIASSSAIGSGGGITRAFVSGTVTDTIALTTAGTNQTLSAVSSTDPLATGSATIGVIGANIPFRLAYGTQPATAVSGSSLGSVTVRVEDAYGNLRTDDTRSITVAIGTNPAAGTLSGTQTVSAVSGIATFAGLSIDKLGTGYTLLATDNSVSPVSAATSSAFDITAGAPVKLVFAVQPGTSTIGLALQPTIAVWVTDVGGNKVSTASTTITIAVDSGTTGAVLGGTTSVATTAGAASFADLTLDRPGQYRLSATASSGGYTAALSERFYVSSGVAAAIAIKTQPSTPARSGIALETPPTVRVVDAGGFPVASSGVSISVAVVEDSATVPATSVQTNANGEATFTGLAITGRAGRSYRLRFTTDALGTVDADPVQLQHGAAARLRLGGDATPLTAGVVRTFSATIQDASGNTVSTGTSATVDVDFSKAAASGAGTVTGLASATAAGGIATIDLTGATAGPLNLVASAPLDTGVAATTATDTLAFSVVANTPHRLVMGTQPSDVVAGSAITPAVTVQVQDAYGNLVDTDTATVTFAIKSGSGASGATLSGTATRTTTDGIATYADLSIDRAARRYVLAAASGTGGSALLGAESDTFAVRAGAPDAAQSVATVTRAVIRVLDSTYVVVKLADALGNRSADSTRAVTAVASTGAGISQITGGGTAGALAFSWSGSDSSYRAGAVGALEGTATTITSAVDGVALTSTKPTILVIDPIAARVQTASVALTVNTPYTPLAPVVGRGGNGAITLALRNAANDAAASLPAGMSFDATTGELSGPPTVTQGLTTYTVRATDAAGDTASASFTLVVNGEVVATQAVASTNLTVNTAYTAFTPVTGTGGTSPLSYALRNAANDAAATLPAGMTFSTTTGEVSGTPTATTAATTYSVRVSDVNGDTASATFALTVNGAVVATQAVASTSLTVNTAYAAFTPVTGSGGTGTLTYTLRNAANDAAATLPAGMGFSTSTGEVSGAATATSVATTYTVVVTDANGATGSATFDLAVNGEVSATQAVASTILTVNTVYTAFTPVTGSGGTGTLSYALRNAANDAAATLPPGMSFSTTTGEVSGTPTSTLAATTYTVRVSDVNGDTASAAFALTVNGGVVATQAVASTSLTVNMAYTAFTPVTGSGGTGTLTYALRNAANDAAASLPAGMTFSTTTGQISGTPTALLTSTTFTVLVTDANGATSAATFTLVVNPGVVATQAVASTSLTVNTAYTAFTPVTGSGGTGTLSYALRNAANDAAATLPAGMTFSTATGEVSGTPTSTLAATTYTVRISDVNGDTASATFALAVNTAVVATQVVASTSLTVNTAYTAFTAVTGSGGTGTLTYALRNAANDAAATLPAGMSFNTATGQISGTPTATAAATTYTVVVTDTNGASASATFALAVNTAVVATQVVASTSLTVNTAYTAFTPVTGSGGTGTLSFALRNAANDAAAALPAGMTFSTATGQVSGTATATAAVTTYSVRVSDVNGDTASATFTLTVNGGVVATQAVASTGLTVNTAYTAFTPVTGSGGTGALTYALRNAANDAAATLPAGMSFSSSTGQVSGTPTATSAATTYTVVVTDANGANASATFTLAVNTAVVATQAVASTGLTVNTAYTAFTPVTGSGGTGTLTYALRNAANDAAATLPAGMTFNTATGQISGTPTATTVTTTYTVVVTDANSANASATFALAVNTAVVATQAVASTGLTVNTAYTAFTPVTGSGGTGTLTYALRNAANDAAATLPAGMTFNTATGQVSGTATGTVAVTTYSVRVSDVNGDTASATFALTVNGAVVATQTVASTSLTVNTAYTAFTPVTGSGGTGTLSYTLRNAANDAAATLPTGMTFNTATGQISGTPTALLTSTTFTILITDANGATSTATFTLVVNAGVGATQAVATTSLTVNTAYAAFTPVTGSGGTGTLTYALRNAANDAAATLPAGMSFSTATGQISGTPTATAAATSYTVRVSDVNGDTASATFALTVNGAVVATQAVASTSLTVNTAYTALTPVTGSGGTGTLSYALRNAANDAAATLPAGMTFSTTTGQISGTPTATSATTTYTVVVTDANGATASATFALTVNGGIVTTQAVASRTFNAGTTITPFAPVTATGGTLPLRYTLEGGALPAAMVFDTLTGTISGTPNEPFATTTFTIRVTDATGASTTSTFTLTVNAALAAVIDAAHTDLTVNSAATPFTPIRATGGTAPLTYALRDSADAASATLPSGLTFDPATGRITGTPLSAQARTTYTIRITDGLGATVTARFAITVDAGIVFAAPAAVANVRAIVTDTTITVAWDVPADTGNASITDYRVQWSPDSGRTWVDATRAASTARSFSIATLTPGVPYTFRVAAVNRIGAGAWSAPSTAVAIAVPPPDLAVALSASTLTPALGDTITLTITVTNAGRGPADAVVIPGVLGDARLRVIETTPSVGAVDVTADTWTIPRLEAGGTATLRIRAIVIIPTAPAGDIR